MTFSYFGLDFGDLECEVDTGCCSRNGFSPSGHTPTNTEAMPSVKLMIVFAQVIDAVLPTVIIFPCLKQNNVFVNLSYHLSAICLTPYCFVPKI